MSFVGVFGGTFDPIHIGHVESAREVQDLIGLERILFIPNATPPHRPPPVASARHRLAMVELALADRPTLEADNRELQRDGCSYTVETLRSLQTDNGSVQLCLILGFDAFLGFEAWYQWQEIRRIARLVVMNRPGWPDQAALPVWCRGDVFDPPTALLQGPPGSVAFVEVLPRDISASGLRQRISRGADVRGDVGAAVWQYIVTHGLYGATAPGSVAGGH